MKKILCKVVALLMIVTLVGCNSTKNNGTEPGIALNTFYQAVLEAQSEEAEELILFEESNPALIESFYPGLENIELNQKAFYMPPIATHPCEIVMVEVKKSEDVQAVIDIFQARIDMGADNVSYPESAAGWKLYAKVHQSGNYVCMIVLPEGYFIPDNVFDLVKK